MPEDSPSYDFLSPSDKEFEPYAKEIGFLLWEWNSLQDTLAKLFAVIANEQDHRMGLAIWHAIPNDRFQRGMLKAAASCRFNPDHVIYKGGPKDPDASEDTRQYYNEIEWIVGSMVALGTMRDASAHTPLRPYSEDPLSFIADYLFGNPNAAKLRGTDLLIEFRVYRERARILKEHAGNIMNTFLFRKEAFSSYPFPQRPSWPERPNRPPDE